MTNDQTIKIPQEQNFSLTKVKLDKDDGIDIHYSVSEVVGQEHYSNEFHVKSSKQVHPDLKEHFNVLRASMARVIHFSSFRTMSVTKEFNADKDQLELVQNHFEELLNKIEIRGISLSGNDDNVAVIMTALLEVGNGQKTVINTPRIKFNTETYGFEIQLEEVIQEIEKECYAFLFKGKKAQLELFDGFSEDDEASN